MFKKLFGNKENSPLDKTKLEFEKVQYNLNLSIAKLEEQTDYYKQTIKRLDTRKNALTVMKIQLGNKGDKDQGLLKDIQLLLNQLEKDRLPEPFSPSKQQDQYNTMWEESYKHLQEEMNYLQDEMQAVNQQQKLQYNQAKEDKKQEQLANFQSSIIKYLE